MRVPPRERILSERPDPLTYRSECLRRVGRGLVVAVAERDQSRRRWLIFSARKRPSARCALPLGRRSKPDGYATLICMIRSNGCFPLRRGRPRRPAPTRPATAARHPFLTSRPCRRRPRSGGRLKAAARTRRRVGRGDAPDDATPALGGVLPWRAAGKARNYPALEAGSLARLNQSSICAVEATWSSCLPLGKTVSSCR